MTREEALSLLKKNIKTKNLIKHSLAVEAAMRKLAAYFNKDQAQWGLTGLLHDIDYEETKDEPKKHSLVGAKMLKELSLEEDIVKAVKTHNEAHGIKPKGLMAKALYCVDPLTGLIVAATLISPSKKIRDIDVNFVLRRFNEKAFARSVNREIIKEGKPLLDLELKEFVSLTLEAMQEIDKELGL